MNDQNLGPEDIGEGTATLLNPAYETIFSPLREADSEKPFVIGQLGLSLDGRIATRDGHSFGLNGDAGLDHLHRLRAEVDAVVVGASTLEADDPQLTVRRCKGRNPARVVIDPSGRIGANGRWLTRDGTRCLVVSAAGRAPHGAELLRVPHVDGVLPPLQIVAALYATGLRRLLIEGGARTLSLFIDAGAVHRLHLLVAPILIGSGKVGFDLAPQDRMETVLRPRTAVYFLAGQEVLYDCEMPPGAVAPG